MWRMYCALSLSACTERISGPAMCEKVFRAVDGGWHTRRHHKSTECDASDCKRWKSHWKWMRITTNNYRHSYGRFGPKINLPSVVGSRAFRRAFTRKRKGKHLRHRWWFESELKGNARHQKPFKKSLVSQNALSSFIRFATHTAPACVCVCIGEGEMLWQVHFECAIASTSTICNFVCNPYGWRCKRIANQQKKSMNFRSLRIDCESESRTLHPHQWNIAQSVDAIKWRVSCSCICHHQ